MKTGVFILLFFLLTTEATLAQRECAGQDYSRTVSSAITFRDLEGFINTHTLQQTAGRLYKEVIKIPVVVHVLYHFPNQKIDDAIVHQQLALLNECFRKQNADTVNIPAAFKSLAADCEIEFKLATSDPNKRSTTGIIKKYTPLGNWGIDDKVKFSSEMGDDAWDPKSYMNIWVCDLNKFAGYSSVVGGAEKVDGLVIDFGAFKAGNKTIVHEAGHWMSLLHIWGDENCGDDKVSDTPKQASYTPGCPTGIRITCGNGPTGDMYNNYMDFTNDACINMFSKGQKARMRALFEPSGPRNSLLTSKGLDTPLIFESPLPDDDPKWLEPHLYPNPAKEELKLDLTYDARWLGTTVRIINIQGNALMTVVVNAKTQTIDVSRLVPGMYFLAAKRTDGLSIRKKFIKQ